MLGASQCCTHVIACHDNTEYANTHEYIDPPCTLLLVPGIEAQEKKYNLNEFQIYG